MYFFIKFADKLKYIIKLYFYLTLCTPFLPIFQYSEIYINLYNNVQVTLFEMKVKLFSS